MSDSLLSFCTHRHCRIWSSYPQRGFRNHSEGMSGVSVASGTNPLGLSHHTFQNTHGGGCVNKIMKNNEPPT